MRQETGAAPEVYQTPRVKAFASASDIKHLPRAQRASVLGSWL